MSSEPADGNNASALDRSHLPPDTVGLLEGLTSTRSIRRYRDEPVPGDALRAILFAATRAPSGSNRQPFRFLVLTDGPKAREAKALIGAAARRAWGAKRGADGYDERSGTVDASPKSPRTHADGCIAKAVSVVALQHRRPCLRGPGQMGWTMHNSGNA